MDTSEPEVVDPWVLLDRDRSLWAFNAIERHVGCRFVAPFRERPRTDDPMDDVILLFGGLVRRRNALRVAMAVESPALAGQILAEQHTWPCSPDSPEAIATEWDSMFEEGMDPDLVLAILHAASDEEEEEDQDDGFAEAAEAGLPMAA